MDHWISDELHEMLNIVNNLFHVLIYLRANANKQLEAVMLVTDIIGVPLRAKVKAQSEDASKATNKPV